MHLSVLSVCMCTRGMPCAHRGLELALEMAVEGDVGAESQTWTLSDVLLAGSCRWFPRCTCAIGKLKTCRRLQTAVSVCP